MTSKTALVTRATGSQGKATAKHLVAAGWTVRALVPDPSQPRAVEVETLGAVLWKGDPRDIQSVEPALRGCDALFLVQMPSFADGNAETIEAASVIELAKKSGVNHIVHSTSLGLNDPEMETRVAGLPVAPALLGKRDVERLVKDSGIVWTILRPGYFMTNFTRPLVNFMFPDLVRGHFINSWNPDTVLPLVNPDDIGAFAAASLDNPTRFAGKIISIASEKKTIADTVEAISSATGKDIKVIYRTEDENKKAIEGDDPLASAVTAGQCITREMGDWVEMDEVTAWGISLTSFGTFLQKNKASLVP